MATEVKIPNLGESISSGILANWHVKSGDIVQAGQALFELETDKITSEGTAEVAGMIDLQAEEGTEVEVGSIVAVIDETKAAEAKSEPKESSEREKPKEEKAEAETDKASPQHPASVRRLADESGIDPETVDGSGKGGRVTKGDMLKAIEKGKEAKASENAEPEPAKPVSPESDETPRPKVSPATSAQRTSRKKMSPLRRTIANRLVQAQQNTAMLTTFNEADMTAVMNFRKTHQDAFVERHGIKLGFMSFFAKAVVQALRQVPGVNAQLDGEEIVQNHYYDLGIAVSTPKGLMVPVLRDCEAKSFGEIEKDILGFASKAREGKITIEDIKGGVFTITNGGIFGSMLSTPILNTPQSAILGMHAIQERPVAINGEVVIRPMMYLALSYDHRIIDGREAVTFLVSIKKSIEDPSRLLFEL